MTKPKPNVVLHFTDNIQYTEESVNLIKQIFPGIRFRSPHSGKNLEMALKLDDTLKATRSRNIPDLWNKTNLILVGGDYYSGRDFLIGKPLRENGYKGKIVYLGDSDAPVPNDFREYFSEIDKGDRKIYLCKHIRETLGIEPQW